MPKGLRTNTPPETTAGLARRRIGVCASLVLLGIVAGLFDGANLEFQALMPLMAEGVDMPRPIVDVTGRHVLVAVAGLATFAASILGNGIVERLLRRHQLRVLTAAGAALTAVALVGLASASTIWALIAWSAVLGLVNQGWVAVHARALRQTSPSSRYYLAAQAIFLFGLCLGFYAGRLIDAFYGPRGWSWAVLAHAIVIATLCLPAYLLVGREPDNTPQRARGRAIVWLTGAFVAVMLGTIFVAWLTGLDQWGFGLLPPLLVLAVLCAGAMALAGVRAPVEDTRRPDADLRHIGRVRLWSQATLVLFDTCTTLLLELRGFTIEALYGVALTLVVGALFAIAMTLGAVRHQRLVLMLTVTIVTAWPLVGGGFVLPAAHFPAWLWGAALVMEGTTSTLRNVLPLLRPDVPEGFRAALLARRSSQGQLIGIGLTILVLSFERTAARFGVPLQWPLVAVGTVLGLFVAYELRVVWRARVRAARPSAIGMIVGAGTGLGYAALSLPGVFVVQIGAAFEKSMSEVFLLLSLGWALMFGCLEYVRRRRGWSLPRWSAVVLVLIGAAGAEIVALASGLAMVAIGVGMLGAATAAAQIVQIEQRSVIKAREGSTERLNTTIGRYTLIINGVVLGGATLTTDFRFALHLVPIPLLALAVIYASRKSMFADAAAILRRNASRETKVLRRDRHAPMANTRWAAFGIQGTYAAIYVPLAPLMWERGGFGTATVIVLAVLTVVRMPAAFVLEYWQTRRAANPGAEPPSQPRTARWCLHAAGAVAVAMALLALWSSGLALATGIGFGIFAVEALLGIAYVAAKSRWDAAPNPRVTAFVVPQWKAVSGVALNTLAGGALAGSMALAHAVPGTALGVTVADAGRALVLATGGAFALLAAAFGTRPPLVRNRHVEGHGTLLLAVIPPDDGGAPGVLIRLRNAAPIVCRLAPGERVRMWRSDGAVFAVLEPLEIPAAPAGWLRRVVYLSGNRGGQLLSANGTAWFGLRWHGRPRKGSKDRTKMVHMSLRVRDEEREAVQNAGLRVGLRMEGVRLTGFTGFGVEEELLERKGDGPPAGALPASQR
jgi:hypothetical protein